jgi:hypothetical protein
MLSRNYALPSSLLLLLQLDIVGSWKKVIRGMVSLPGLFVISFSTYYLFFSSTNVFADWCSIASAVGGFVLFLLVLILVNLGLAGKTMYFSEADTQFLMTEPLSDRDLLSYRLIQHILQNFYIAVGLSLFIGHPSGSSIDVFLRIYPMLCAIGLIPLAVCSVPQKGYKKLVRFSTMFINIVFSFLLILGGAWSLGFVFAISHFTTFASVILPWVYKALAPFIWTNNLLFSPGIQISIFFFLVGSIVCLICALVSLRYTDIRHDSFLANGRETILKQETLSRNGLVFRPNRALEINQPDFKNLDGLGPILWKKLREQSRNVALLLIFCGICLLFQAFNVILYSKGLGHGKLNTSLLGRMWETQFMALLFAIMTASTDFKSDIQKLEFLKSLPLRSSKVVLGQTLISALSVFVLLVFASVIDGITYNHYFLDSSASSTFKTLLWGFPISALYSTGLGTVCLLFPSSGVEKRNENKFYQPFISILVSYALFSMVGVTIWWSSLWDKSHGNSGVFATLVPLLIISLAAFFSFRLEVRVYERFDISRIGR